MRPIDLRQASLWYVAADQGEVDDQEKYKKLPTGPTEGGGSGGYGSGGGSSWSGGTDPHAPPASNATMPASGGGSSMPSSMPGSGSPAPVSYSPGAGSKQWEQQVELGLQRNGLPVTLAPQVEHQIDTESSGNPNAINNTDSNAQAGHPSQGLLQTIPSTFNTYHLPGDSMSITDPQANIDSAIGYAKSTYGPGLTNSQGNGMGSGHGYDEGGWLPPGKHTVWNNTGEPELVVPPGGFPDGKIPPKSDTGIHSGQLKSGPWLLEASGPTPPPGVAGSSMPSSMPGSSTPSGGTDWGKMPDVTMGPAAPPGWHPGATPTSDWVGPSSGGGSSSGSPSSSGGSNSSGGGGHPDGGPPSQNLTEALGRAGIDPKMYPMISGFSATEGNNPSGAPTLGFTDSQAGTSLDQHAQALAQQFKDRASVSGEFPHDGTPEQQASWMATTVGQNGSPSDWQGNAQPARSTYVDNIVKSMPTAPTMNPGTGGGSPVVSSIHSAPPKSGAYLLDASEHLADHDDVWSDVESTGAGVDPNELTEGERDKLKQSRWYR